MSLPIPGVLYQRKHPDPVWYAKGRPSLNLQPFLIDVTEPTEKNTGPRTPPQTVVNADVTLTTGQVYEGRQINGRLIIPLSATGDIIIRDCVIDASRVAVTKNGFVVDIHVNTAARVKFEFCEIIGQAALMGVGVRNFEMTRCHVHHVEDAVRLHNFNGTSVPELRAHIYGNKLGPLIVRTPDPYATRTDVRTHSDVIQIEGGTGAHIHGNAMHGTATTDGTSNIEWAMSASPYVSAKSGTVGARPHPQALSCLMLTPSVSPMKDLVFENNWCYGGEIAVNGGSSSNGTSTGVIRRNKFDRTQWFDGHTVDLDATATGITTEGNVYMSDGSAVTVRRNA